MTGAALRGYGFGSCMIVSTAVAVVAAALILALPFAGDQALFALYASALDGGAALYEQVWDAKQPGIFWFFLLAGRLFGFTEIGVHSAEALWLIGHGIGLALVLRHHVRIRWVAGLMPLAAAFFFFSAGVHHLTQVEILISPLVLWVAVLLAGPLTKPWPLILAGGISGSIAAFKLLDLLVPGVILGASVVWHARTGGLRSQIHRVLWFSTGLLPILIVLYFWVESTGVSDLVWWTWLELPRQVLSINPRPLTRLVRSAGAFTLFNAAPLLLGAPLIVRGRGLRSSMAFHVIFAAIGSTLVTLLQLWWAYLFALLVFPVAALALLGLDEMLGANRVPRRLLAVAVALAAVPTLVLGVDKVTDAAALVADGNMHEYRLAFADYRTAHAVADTAPVGGRSRIFVLGNPMVYRALGSEQSIAFNGWSPEAWPEKIWTRVADDLADQGTEAVFVALWARDLADRNAPWFLDRIRDGYMEVHTDEIGAWFVPKRESTRWVPSGRVRLKVG